MSEHNIRSQPPLGGDNDLPASQPAAAPAHSVRWKIWQVLKVIQARLRFVAILVVVGLVIGFWDTINNYYERWTRPLYGQEQTADSDIEYFCPMHLFIVRDNRKEKCPICHMDLARRKKGEQDAAPLAAGTVSRVQLSPYRIVLAGVQTSEVHYQVLSREVAAFGTVEFDETKLEHLAARQKGRIVKLYANYTGQHVHEKQPLALIDVRYDAELAVTLKDLRRARQAGDRADEESALQRLRRWDLTDKQIRELQDSDKASIQLTIYSPIEGHVIRKFQREGSLVEEGTPLYDLANLDSVWAEAQLYEADQGLLRKEMDVRATTLSLPGEVFPGKLDFVSPHLDESTRTLTVRYAIPNPGHKLRPGMYATVTVAVPPGQIDLFSRTLAEDEVRSSAIETLGSPGQPSGLRTLLDTARRRAVLQRGWVLAVPESAVIDTGSLQVVYREAARNEYEGVAVQLGPRMTEPGNSVAFYPILRGLDEGDKVVTNGAFLVDAETRLNPAAGSIYFGGSGGKGTSTAQAVRPSTPVEVSPEDRRLIAAQKTCPITDKPLGSMGTPVKIKLEGRTVFLCCDGCRSKALADPAAVLKKLDASKSRPVDRTAPPDPAVPNPVEPSSKAAKIKANLAALPPGDRATAEEQKYCPITEKPLGSMGVPIKLDVAGQPVFVCCGGCKDDAQKDTARTLAKVKELKDRAKTEAHSHD